MAVTSGPTAPPAPGTLRVRSQDALRRILWSPDELGLARAYVAGDLDADGDLFETLATMRRVTRKGMRFGWSALPSGLAAAGRLGVLGRPLRRPPEEAHLRGGRHSLRRDAAAIGHHYDVGNDFYRIVLGPSMTYSCARFEDDEVDLTAAQASKHELICRKLGLPERPGARLLDVGCGWGSMAIHAAQHHDVSVVGITISRSQADLARKRAAEAGVGDRVEIRLQDYRQLGGERFDAISSIGMSEHVGRSRLAEYYGILRDALCARGATAQPCHQRGRRLDDRTALLRRALRLPRRRADRRRRLGAGDGVSRLRDPRRRITARALHPDAAGVGRQPGGPLGRGGRDGRTTAGPHLAAVHGRLGGQLRRRRINVHQVLGVVPTADGGSGMPATRRSWDAQPR